MKDPKEEKKELDINDPKIQVKYYKKISKDLKKKNVELQEKNTKLQEEMAIITARLKSAEQSLLEESTSGLNQADSSIKDKELILSLQNELEKVRGELKMFEKKSQIAETEVEKIKGNQTKVITEYTGLINELSQKLANETSKNAQDKSKILAIEKKLAEYKKLYDAAQIKLKAKPNATSEKLYEELNRYKKECELLTEKIEHTQSDQDLLNEQNRVAKKIMEEEISQLTESVVQKDGEITTLKSKCIEYKAMYEALAEDNK